MEAFRRLYDDLIGRSGLQMRGMINEADSREIKKGAKNTLFENPRKKGVEIIDGPSKSPQKARKGSKKVAKPALTTPSQKGSARAKKHEKNQKKSKFGQTGQKRGQTPENGRSGQKNGRSGKKRARGQKNGKIPGKKLPKKTCNQFVDCFQRKFASKKMISTTKAPEESPPSVLGLHALKTLNCGLYFLPPPLRPPPRPPRSPDFAQIPRFRPDPPRSPDSRNLVKICPDPALLKPLKKGRKRVEKGQNLARFPGLPGPKKGSKTPKNSKYRIGCALKITRFLSTSGIASASSNLVSVVPGIRRQLRFSYILKYLQDITLT